MSPKEFVFESYRYDSADGSLSLRYRFLDGPRFEERLVFDFASRRLSADAEMALDRIFRLVFLLSGVSYYKAFVPETLRCEAFPIDRDTAHFLQNFYEKGLAEFAWRNRISLQGRCRVLFDPADPPAPTAIDLPRRTCVPVGGGKDSIVTLECLKSAGEDLVLFSLGEAEPIAACIAASELPSIRVRRRLDPGLLTLNEQGALNGHVPITGILSAIVLACAVLAGFDTIAMSNEHSASAPNLTIGGVGINHQYSKSLEFERDFADYIARHITPSIAYFSLLRPLLGNRDRAPFRPIHPIFRHLPQLQHRLSPIAGRARASLVLRLSEMPVRVSRIGPVSSKARADRDLWSRHARRRSPNRRVCRIVWSARVQAVRVRRRNRRKCGGDDISRE